MSHREGVEEASAAYCGASLADGLLLSDKIARSIEGEFVANGRTCLPSLDLEVANEAERVERFTPEPECTERRRDIFEILNLRCGILLG